MADRPRLTVLGAGYLGITHAACMASAGFEVLCVDIDADRVAGLGAGQLPVFEPGLEQLLRAGLDTGRLAFTSSYAGVAEFGDVHFVCVGTPQRRDGHSADLAAQLEACIDTLAPALTRPCIFRTPTGRPFRHDRARCATGCCSSASSAGTRGSTCCSGR
jgi:UDPglucose 6-dehydrogenase